jgi:hypothetical protein
MTDRDSPPRLKSGDDAPAELQRALRALGDSSRDHARLQRVASKLSPLLDGAPSAPSLPAALARHGARKLLAPKLFLAALALGASAVWFTRSQSPTTHPHPAAPHGAPAPGLPSPGAAEPSHDETSARAALGSPAREVSTDSATPSAALERVSLDGDGERAQGPATSVTITNANAGRVALADRPNAAARGERERMRRRKPSAALGASTVVTSAPQAVAEGQAALPEPPSPRSASQGPTEAPQMSEAELLLKARQQMRSDPAAALRLLDEHGARFEQGLLVPEREALAIDALRKLGRDGAAEQRLSAFRTRYPESLHLKQLQR